MKDKFFSTIFSLILILIIAITSLNLQVIQGARLFGEINNGARFKTEFVSAMRGLIFDRMGRPLVENKSSYSLYLNPINILDVNYLKFILSEATFRDIDYAISIYNQNPNYDKVLLDNNYDNSIFITKYLSDPAKYKGIEISPSSQRVYLQKDLFTHIVGYTGEVTAADQKVGYRLNTEIGRDGIESSYDKQLRGVEGKITTDIQTNTSQIQSQPVNGDNLYLSVDIDIQKEMTNILQQGMKDYNADGAAGILENINSGEILSYVSLPTFDDNLFVGGIGSKDYSKLNNDPHSPQIDRNTNAAYPPGSMFKINTATAVLESQSITKDSTFYTGGTFQYGGVTFRDFSNINDGTLNIIGGLCKSSNIFFMKSALEMDNHTNGQGINKILEYANRYGLGTKTGIDLPEGDPGNISSPKLKEKLMNQPWQEGDLFNAAVGQGLTQLSPIQIETMTGAMANGGTVLQPRIVKAMGITGSDQKTPTAPIVRNTINVSPNTLNLIHQGMYCGVHGGPYDGIIQDLNSKYVSVAAKSGTAEFGAPDSSGAYPNRHAWVTAFFPYDHPKYALTLLLERGGTSAHTVLLARKTIDWLYSNYKIDEKIKE